MNSLLKKLQPKKSISFLGIISISLVIIFSCEVDPSSLGADLLPEFKEYNYDSSFTFTSSVVPGKTINTSNMSHYTLGIYEDAYFGTFTGEYAGQFYPSTVFEDDFSGLTIDSAVLFLEIDSIYGLNNSEDIYFNLYELITDIELDSGYYSDVNIEEFYLTENPVNENSIISGDSLLIFKLTDAFANKFISQGTEIYDSAALFREKFKGICITPELINSPGGLITANFTSSNSKIILYYQMPDEDSLKTYFSLSYRFAKYTNDFSTGLVNEFINNDENEDDSLLFIQGLTGVKSKFKFSNLDEWYDSDSVFSILNAELTVPIANYDNNGISPPDQVYFYYTTSDSSLIQIEDYLLSGFGGKYYDTSNVYTFNISKHFMELLNGNIEDPYLNFTFYNKSFFPNNVVLESNKIKLKVTYTKH